MNADTGAVYRGEDEKRAAIMRGERLIPVTRRIAALLASAPGKAVKARARAAQRRKAAGKRRKLARSQRASRRRNRG